jgi:hypothetical protein
MDDEATPSPPPKRLWLSYAWTDNKSDDVDFIAQELEANGLRVHLDRWNIVGGQRLWDQIGKAITDPNESDAWALYATQSSLTSDPCIEELNYALGRALETRGDVFPLIGIFQTQLSQELIPPALRVRLYYSIQSTTWAADVAAAARGEVAARSRPKVEPYEISICSSPLVDGV